MTWLLQPIDGHSAMLEASRNGHYQIVQLLLTVASSDDCVRTLGSSMGATPLHLACLRDHEDIVIALLHKDSTTTLNATSLDGWTPLHWACAYGSIRSTKLLLAAGADRLARDDLSGATPLHLASRWGHAEILNVLLQNADDSSLLETEDDNGLTALGVACRWGNVNFAACLIEAGAYMDDVRVSSLAAIVEEALRVVNERSKGSVTNLKDANLNSRISLKPSSIILAATALKPMQKQQSRDDEDSFDDIPMPSLQLGGNIACSYVYEDFYCHDLIENDECSTGAPDIPRYHDETSGWSQQVS